MENNETSTSVNKLTSGWKIKIKSHSNATQQQHIPAIPIVESDSAFNERIDQWAKTPNFINMFTRLQQEVQTDIDRRQKQRINQYDKQLTTTASITNDTRSNNKKEDSNENKDDNNQPFIFEKPSTLSKNDYEAWFYSKNDSIHHPHQWLKLASLFHIHSKTANQSSLLSTSCLNASQMDRQLTKEMNEKQLESYLELRQIQNRKYAEDAVIEGIKLYEQQKNKEALEFYKRALDMDPQYADGWYHVAQSLLQEKRTDDAIIQLKRALKIEPNHEKAKTLLCTLENTSTDKKAKKPETKDSHTIDGSIKKHIVNINDTNEILMDESSDDNESDRKRHRRSEKHKKKRKSRHRSRSRSRSPSKSSSSYKRKRRNSRDDNMDNSDNDNKSNISSSSKNKHHHDHRDRHFHSSSNNSGHHHQHHRHRHLSHNDNKYNNNNSSSSSHSKYKNNDDHDHNKDSYRYHRSSKHDSSLKDKSKNRSKERSRERSKDRSSKHHSSRHSHGRHK